MQARSSLRFVEQGSPSGSGSCRITRKRSWKGAFPTSVEETGLPSPAAAFESPVFDDDEEDDAIEVSVTNSCCSTHVLEQADHWDHGDSWQPLGDGILHSSLANGCMRPSHFLRCTRAPPAL